MRLTSSTRARPGTSACGRGSCTGPGACRTRTRSRADRMCGIAVIAGPQPSEATFRTMLDELRPRGEVEEVAADDRLLAGTHRLRITDPAGGVQPWISADGRYLLCLNGEIFNYRA